MPKASPKPVRLNDFLTVSLAAEFLGVSPSTLRNWDRGGKLRAIRHPVIAAADEFQDLNAIGSNAAVDWLRSVVAPTSLNQNHRTTCADLLASAADLREGRPLPSRDRCKILSAANPNAAAGIIACNLVWFGIAGTVVLTPTGPDSSAFVKKVIARQQAKSIKSTALKGAEVGPFRIDWESHASLDASRLVECLNLQAGATDVDTRTLCVPQSVRGGRSLQEWVDRQRRVLGRDRIPVQVLQVEASRVCQQLRAMRPTSEDRLVSMTLHQAKNREFDRVIVLWPYEISGAPEKLRRLLYNGITRARQRAIIVVQNPPTSNPSRLTVAPFAV
ncbi:RecBCD enzyme subunit RecD [Phycisphaerae bacterium RAS2]|nr:RecBCD enzyme subunit RecD [Phycisphaerae bacterium RAS2]